MKLIKDLGIIQISDGSKYYARFGIYECSECKSHFKSNTSKVKSRKIELCPKCAKDGRHKITHGMTGTRIHTQWNNMLSRCKDLKNDNYAARGISVCEEWLRSFETFYNWATSNGYTDMLEIDRIDTNGNYEPTNCRFVNRNIQNANKRILNKKNGLITGIHAHGSKFKAMITHNNNIKYLGIFDTIDEAIKIRNNFIIANNLPHTIIDLEILKEQI